MSSSASRSPWHGRLFFGQGWLLYAGAVGPTEPHAHHSFQLARVDDASETVLLGVSAVDAVFCRGAVIPPDVMHVIVRGTSQALLLYVEPESRSGRRLRRATSASAEPVTWRSAGCPLESLAVTPPGSWTEAASLVDRLLATLVQAEALPVVLHPAVARALLALPELLGRDVRAAAVAARAGVSEGRLTHLFGREVGLPMRAYVRWLRLQRAATTLQAGGSLTDAAHAAGFADSAHLTRTFKQMFGLTPSTVMAAADFVSPPQAASTP